MTFRVAIIGGGPGGYVTAIRFQQKGIEALLFEKERLGGECLNWGCIPTKALVKIGDLYNEIQHAEKFGINIENIGFDYRKIGDRKNDVVEKLVSGLEFIIKKRKINLISQKVISIQKRESKFTIKTAEQSYEADYIVIATGSRPAELPNMKFDGENFLSSRHILTLTELPKHLTIIGGGTIGCEFASICANLGVEIEIIELLPNLLNNEDREIGKKLHLAFKKKGIKTHLNTKVNEYRIESGKVFLKLTDGKEIVTEKVLISTGRIPYCDIEFENCQPETERQAMSINDEMETTIENMFAIGDVTGKLMLAHTASKQGLLVAEIIERRINQNKDTESYKLIYQNIPRCTFTEPEVASVGLTQEQAEESGSEIEIGKFTYMGNGKAIGLGATDGMIKVIADKNNRKILGMHIVGAQATELITAGSIMINLGLTINELHKVVYAHPTLSEIIMEAVEDLDKVAIHKI
ncbi:MAG: dihydrolipoyl dehydrogenase [Candidatus Cloacimonetes bacterium]|nr:dihydrolipoyl dehydrogenase [Candidatus Cloacimonadota bacterium]